MLFRNKTVTDSEEFVFPNIETVKVTIEGTPNQIHGQGIPKNRFYDEAKRLFGNGAENPLITPLSDPLSSQTIKPLAFIALRIA